MLKILFVHHTSDFNGGSDKSLFEFIIHLDREKISPLVCLRIGDPYIEKYEAKGVKVITKTLFSPPKKLISLQGMKFLFTFFPSIISLIFTIIRSKIDVVHVNTSINIQGGLAGFFSRRPVVWHVRELLGDSFLDSAVKKVVTVFATKIVTISKAVYDSIGGTNKALVYNGMDLSDYSPKDYSGDIVVNCVGRIEEWKGQHVALNAIAKIYEKYPHVKFQFIGAAAVNKPDYYDSLVNCVTSKRMTNVKFLGSREDVPKILQNSQVLLVPTCTSEPFGRTVIEGMAAGNIVIATNAGGPKEIITDKYNGFLVKINSATELADVLTYVLGNIDNLNTVRENAVICVKNNFDIKRVSKMMESVFYEVST